MLVSAGCLAATWMVAARVVLSKRVTAAASSLLACVYSPDWCCVLLTAGASTWACLTLCLATQVSMREVGQWCSPAALSSSIACSVAVLAWQQMLSHVSGCEYPADVSRGRCLWPG